MPDKTTLATVLTKGMAGERVVELQKALNETQGENLVVDGIFGVKTRDAVKRVQKKLGLNATGQADINLVLKLPLKDFPTNILYFPKHETNKETTQKEYNLPVKVTGTKDIIAKFGDCFNPSWDAANLVPIRLPGEIFKDGQDRVTKVNIFIDEHVMKCVNEMIAQGLKFESYDGCLNKRYVRGKSKKLSTHSWGLALDFDAEQNTLGTKGKMDPRIVQIFKNNGFIWGGDFKNRKDFMHFQSIYGY